MYYIYIFLCNYVLAFHSELSWYTLYCTIILCMCYDNLGEKEESDVVF